MSDGDGNVPDNFVPGLVAVGYGGLRLVSRDNGVTWTDRQIFSQGNVDDPDLLRAIAYGNGVWVASGLGHYLRSVDGVEWTETTPVRPDNTCLESIVFGKGKFVGVCGQTSYISTDGLTWTKGGDIGDLSGHNVVQFNDGKFVATGDSEKTFTSTDGSVWTELAGVTFGRVCEGEVRNKEDCHRAKWFDGVWFRIEWAGKIMRSTNGTSFTQVYSDADTNSLYTDRADAPSIAVGMVAP